MTTLCHCGRPIHYAHPETQEKVESLIKHAGEYVTVTCSDGRKWRVQRHYIALHGIKEQEIPELGFEQIG